MEVTNPLAQAEQALLEQLQAAQKQVDDIQAMINGIRGLQKKEPIITKAKVEKPRMKKKSNSKFKNHKRKGKFPVEYAEANMMYQKVFVAINNLKEGTVYDVMKELKRLDPKNKDFKNAKYLRKFTANGLYQLLNEHKKIKAFLAGRNYRYSV